MIAITRIALCSALGDTLDATVDALRCGRVGIRTPIALEQAPRINAGAGECPSLRVSTGAFRAEELLRNTVHDLLTPADHTSIKEAPDRWGVILGTTLAGMRHGGDGLRAELSGDMDAAETAYARVCASSVLAQAFRDIGITGPTMTVSCACASALSAVSHACALLEAGDVDKIIAGGYDPIAEFAYGGFSALQLVASGPLSPFAHEREGMKLGEGVALFLLQRIADAAPSIRGVILATAQTSDAHHLTQPHPQGNGAARALEAVCREGGEPNLLIAHATGTPGNDAAEYAAYQSAFGGALSTIPVLALKGRFGHALGAAGVLEAAAVLGCAEEGFTPTSAGRGRDEREFPALQLFEGETLRPACENIAVLSAGFGGANAAMHIVRGAKARAMHTAAKLHCHAQVSQESTEFFITATGAVTPAGRGIAALKESIHARAACPHFDESILTPLLDRAKTRRIALLPRIIIGAVRDLLDTHALTTAELRETPILVASWLGTTDFTERYYRDLLHAGIDLANPMLFAESVPNIGSAHCSIAFGIEAASMSVVGRRTAGIEALALARARFVTGAWSRAIVVAAEEASPLAERALTRASGQAVQLRTSAVAFLLERAPKTPRRESIVIDEILLRTSVHAPAHRVALLHAAATKASSASPVAISSRSPVDGPVHQGWLGAHVVDMCELGAVTPLALTLAGILPASLGAHWIVTDDPHGACAGMRIRTPSC